MLRKMPIKVHTPTTYTSSKWQITNSTLSVLLQATNFGKSQRETNKQPQFQQTGGFTRSLEFDSSNLESEHRDFTLHPPYPLALPIHQIALMLHNPNQLPFASESSLACEQFVLFLRLCSSQFLYLEKYQFQLKTFDR